MTVSSDYPNGSQKKKRELGLAKDKMFIKARRLRDKNKSVKRIRDP